MTHSHLLIAPSILSADFLLLGEQIALCERAGADWIHVDVMDGHFVPNLTMGPYVVAHVRRATTLPVDVHLMIENPESMLESFALAGASHLTVHIEACRDIVNTLNTIKNWGCKAGVTLNPSTPVDQIASALPHADLVLVMTVNPGYSGQAFMPEVLPKLSSIRTLLKEMGSSADLEVDGGINSSNIVKVRDSGANVFVAAHAIFNHPKGIAAGLHELRKELSRQCP